MVINTISVVVLLGSGITAGVLFAVALSVSPAMIAMRPDRYVEAHKLLGKNWDPTMPLVVLSSCLLDVLLTVLTLPSVSGILFGAAAVVLLGVSGVSHLANVPINKRVRTLDPERIPADWPDPRGLWRNWNLLRTVLAVLALTLNGTAVVLL